jgi:hypothetical protein
MLFQLLVNKMCSQYRRFVASLLRSCDNAVPTTCQKDVCNKFVARLLTSCDNAVPKTCQQDVFATGL